MSGKRWTLISVGSELEIVLNSRKINNRRLKVYIYFFKIKYYSINNERYQSLMLKYYNTEAPTYA